MDTEKILTVVFSVVTRETVEEVILFGKRPGRDIDILVIVTGKSRHQTCYLGQVNIATVGIDWVPMLIANLDPMVIEPILTGEKIFGYDVLPEKNTVLSSRGTVSSAEYLANCAGVFLIWAMKHLEQGRVQESFCCLSFTISYFLFSQHYKEEREVIDFKTLKERTKHLHLSWAMASWKGEIPSDEPKLRRVIAETLCLLTSA